VDDRTDGRLTWKRYYGGNRSRDVKDYVDYDIIFTTYGITTREKGENMKHVLHHLEWHRIILDESHTIKNGASEQSKSILSLRARNRWCLTGTPFGKHVDHIENQLKFIGMEQKDLAALNMKQMTKSKLFMNGGSGLYGKDNAIPLLNVMPKVVMRHKKDQQFDGGNIVTMPDKEENVIYVDFTARQREYYDKLYATAKERYEYYKTINGIGRASIQILASLHPARQACSGMISSKEEIEKQLSEAQSRTYHVRQLVKEVDPNMSSTDLFQMAEEEGFADRDGECPICLECPFDDPLVTECRHTFCRECIVGYLQTKAECPMCRKKTTTQKLKKPKEDKPADNQNDDAEKLNESTESLTQPADGAESDDDQIRFDSKLKRLIEELRVIRRDRPNDKVLVFTSFTKSLQWMCSELERNGFAFRTLTGSMTMNKRKQQLESFSNDDDVKVFVLTVRSGAVGITLTAANHVFLMEPPFNPALYRQAINRVYRLGQTKKVYIHTMIMRNSIEQRIWNVNKEKVKDSNTGNDSGGSKRRMGMAGNICGDRSANLDTHEVSKLFEDNQNNGAGGQ